MRPTLLQFRSPKERTPEFYNPDVTYDGRKISYTPDRSTTIPHSARFPQYKEAETKTTIIVGPGAYENDPNSISKSPVRSILRYSRPHGGKQTGNNGYFMVGDQLVFDANLMPNRGQYHVTDPYCKVDESSALSSRRTRASSRPSSMLMQRQEHTGFTSPRRSEARTPIPVRKRARRAMSTPKKTERDKVMNEFSRLFDNRFKTVEHLLKET